MLCAGYYGVPLPLAAQQMVAGVMAVLQRGTEIKYIRLVDIRPEMVACIKQNLQDSCQLFPDLVIVSTERGKNRNKEKLAQIVGERGLMIVDQKGNGNCQYIAVSHQVAVVHGQQISAGELRAMVVQHLIHNPHTVSIPSVLLVIERQ